MIKSKTKYPNRVLKVDVAVIKSPEQIKTLSNGSSNKGVRHQSIGLMITENDNNLDNSPAVAAEVNYQKYRQSMNNSELTTPNGGYAQTRKYDSYQKKFQPMSSLFPEDIKKRQLMENLVIRNARSINRIAEGSYRSSNVGSSQTGFKTQITNSGGIEKTSDQSSCQLFRNSDMLMEQKRKHQDSGIRRNSQLTSKGLNLSDYNFQDLRKSQPAGIDFEKVFKYNDKSISSSVQKIPKTHKFMEMQSTLLDIPAPVEIQKGQIQLKDIHFKNLTSSVKKRLEASQQTFFVEHAKPIEHQLKEYQNLQKLTFINLQGEFLYHQKCMSEIKIFKNVLMNMDYTFYRNIIGCFIDTQALYHDNRTISQSFDINQLNTPNEIIEKLADENIENPSSNISIEKSYHTYLTPEMQSYIPQNPVKMDQNGKLTDLWRDQKDYLNKLLKKHHLMTTHEESQSTKVSELSIFIKEMAKLMDRFMKIISQEENNIPAALFIDQFFKTLIIKLDKTLSITEKANKKIKKEANLKVKQSQENSKEIIDLNNEKLKIERKFMETQKQEMIDLIAAQQKQIEYLQQIVDEKKIEIKELTSFDSRDESMRKLNDQFVGMKQIFTEHDYFRKNQVKLIDEYTKMIDIGIAKIPRFDQCPQTDLSLQSSHILDEHLFEHAYPPVIAISKEPQDQLKLSLYEDFKVLFEYSENLIEHHTNKTSFQNQILNGFMNDQVEKLDVARLQTNCSDLIAGIQKQKKQGNLYANLISKIFGFEKMNQYDQIVKAFLRERQNYIKYYENEPEDQKQIKDLEKVSIQSPRKTKKKKRNASPKKTPNKKEIDASPEPVELEDEENLQPDEEHLNMLSLQRVFDYITSTFKQPLGSKILKNILNSMDSKHTFFFPKLQGQAIESIFENDPNFSKVMVSLYYQASQKTFEIQQSFKQYDSSAKIGMETFDPKSFKEALSKYWVTEEEVKTIYRFMNPQIEGLDEGKCNNNLISIKQFMEYFNSQNMYTFNQIAFVSTQYVLNAILEGIQQQLESQKILIQAKMKHIIFDQQKKKTPKNAKKSMLSSKKKENSIQSDHDSQSVEEICQKDLSIKKNQTSVFVQPYQNPNDYFKSFKNFSEVSQKILKDFTLSQNLLAFKKYILSLDYNCDSCLMATETIIDCYEDALNICNLNI